MSFYLDRFAKSYSQTTRGSGYTHLSAWASSRKLNHVHEIQYMTPTYTEETYKGFAMIVVHSPIRYTQLLDDQGNPINYYSPVKVTKGESVTTDDYFVYAWRIGTEYDHKTTLRWSGEFADLNGVCMTRKYESTVKQAKKKLDIIDKSYEVADRLAEISNVYLPNTDRVINARIGELVAIWAWGRMREGVVVGTSGSRFVIAYVTPTSPKEIKMKTLPLPAIYQGVSTL